MHDIGQCLNESVLVRVSGIVSMTKVSYSNSSADPIHVVVHLE